MNGHLDLSDKHKCTKCGKAIKLKLVTIKGKIPTTCYKCYKESK